KSFISRYNAKSDVFTLGLILTELCVVMDYDQKMEVFNNFRCGKPNDVFADDETDSLVKKLTDMDSKRRPTCKAMLSDRFFALNAGFFETAHFTKALTTSSRFLNFF
ncbi:hypothetical protein PMAYCL1PPCAC_01299, partial [Pristionchus mayeri]